MMLTRLSRANIGRKPPSIYFALKKCMNNFSLQRNERTEINFPKNYTCLQNVDRGMRTKNSRYGIDLDSTSFQLPSEDLKVQKKNSHDLSKKLKLLLRETTGKRRQYITDRNVAEVLVHYLKRDIENDDIIVESSPGLGLLTETILAETSNDIVVYEPNKNLRSNLQTSLLPQNSDRLQINDHDLEKFYGYYVIDQREPEKPILQNFLDPMLRKQGSEFLPVRILGVIYDARFITKLILCYSFQCCLYGEISPILYLFMPFSIYNKIAPSPNYVYSHQRFLSSYYFNIETLHVVSKESFYPIPTKSGKKIEDDPVYLVKISPRKEFFEEVPRNELENFHYFINTVSRIKKSDFLIKRMERWIPDCGPELIKNGIHVFAHPKELSPRQLLQAYRIFINLPSYQESTFHYQRQQFVATFGQKSEEIELQEKKSSDETIDLEDHEFLET